MQEKFLHEYEKNMVQFLERKAEFASVGVIAYATANAINGGSIEISWYPNVSDRFHEVRNLYYQFTKSNVFDKLHASITNQSVILLTGHTQL